MMPPPLEPPVPENHDTVIQELNQAGAAVARADKLLDGGQLVDAKVIIDWLLTQPYHREKVAVLLTKHNRLVAQQATPMRNRLDGQKVLSEVQERLNLPDTYGKVTVITPDLLPLEAPEGRMEGLLNRSIDIDLENADVQGIVAFLRDQEGLNIIADQALQGQNNLTISAKQIPIGELFSYISRNMGIAFHLGENVVWVTAADPAPSNGPKLETRMYELRRGYIPGASGNAGGNSDFADDRGGGGGGSASADDLLDVLNGFLLDNPDSPEGAKLEIYRNRNLLLIRNTRENLRLAENLIRKFDQLPKQVLIEARFMTVSEDDLFQLGVTVDELIYSNGEKFGAEGSALTPAGFLSSAISGASAGTAAVGGVINNVTYSVVIDALEELGSTKTLSAPRVTVLNNQQANIRRGDNITYVSDEEVSITTRTNDDGTTTRDIDTDPEIDTLELGIELEVTPSIGNDDHSIILSLSANVTELVSLDRAGSTDESTDSSGDGEQNLTLITLPHTNESTLTTAVAVGSGETVVMGGMVTTMESDVQSKVPFLGDIPLLGYLFRKKETVKTPNHLLIFVTATIIGEDGQFIRVLRESTP